LQVTWVSVIHLFVVIINCHILIQK
jgi:hypothetical protein